MKWLVPAALLCGVAAAHAEETVFAEDFATFGPDAQPFANIWGDKPETVEQNAVVAGTGAVLKLTFGGGGDKKHLSYWSYRLEQPIPLVDGLDRIEVSLRTNVKVQLKVGMSPFGFIYHGPGVEASDQPQLLALPDAAKELQAWCRKGERDPRQGYVSSIILAVAETTDVTAELLVQRIAIVGADGTRGQLDAERLNRRAAAIRVAAVSMLWSDEERTIDKALEWVTIAHHLGADLVSLPQECVATAGEPIPGPITDAFAAKAKELGLWICGNIRERAEGKTYVTSFLLDRSGELVGTYRKSHKLPDEDLDLGDALPVFQTELGKVAMKIGTDRHFAEIDHCYAVQGCQLLLWAQMPEPVEDEYLQDRPVPGMAIDYNMTYVCSRYASAEPGYITDFLPTYLGRPIGRSYVVGHEGLRIACTGRTGGGVAVATIPLAQFGGGRNRPQIAGFRPLGEPDPMPPKPEYAKRVIKVAAIDPSDVPTLLARLDECGRQGVDIACTYEFVWVHGAAPEQVAAMEAKAKQNLAQVAAKAKQYGMYVLVAGVVDRLERNEAILYDRGGNEVWRYFKIVRTHDEQITGDQVPVYDTDFGRLGCWICADEAHVEIPRVLHALGADLLFTPTQSWGPDAVHRDDRDISRAMNAGLFLVEATHPSSEPLHQSKIIDPCGNVVAQSGYWSSGLVTAVLDLDHHRPRRYAREWTPHTPGGYLPEYQSTRTPAEYNDLFDVIRAQRRPELYRDILWPSG